MNGSQEGNLPPEFAPVPDQIPDEGPALLAGYQENAKENIRKVKDVLYPTPERVEMKSPANVDLQNPEQTQTPEKEIERKKQENIATLFEVVGQDPADIQELKNDFDNNNITVFYNTEQKVIDNLPEFTDQEKKAKKDAQDKLNQRKKRLDVYQRLDSKDPRGLEKIAQKVFKIREERKEKVREKLEKHFGEEGVTELLKTANLKELAGWQKMIDEVEAEGGASSNEIVPDPEMNFAKKFLNKALTDASLAFLHGVKTSNMDRLIDALMGINTQGAIGTTADLGSFYKNIEGVPVTSSAFIDKINERPQEFAIKLYEAKEEFKTAGMPLDERLFLDPLRKAARADTQEGALPDLKLALHYIVRMIYHHPDGQKIATVLFEPFAKALFGGKVLSGDPAKEVLEILSKENTTGFEGRKHFNLWGDDFKTTEA